MSNGRPARTTAVAVCVAIAWSATSAADVQANRAAIARVSGIEQLCNVDPGHRDCGLERRRAFCANLAAPEVASSAADASLELALVRYVAATMIDGACLALDERGTDDEDLGALFRSAFLERHFDARGVAERFDGDLRRSSRRVLSVDANLRHSTQSFERFAQADADATFKAGDRTISREELLSRMAARLPELARSLQLELVDFEAHFGAAPGARYALDRFRALAYNHLAHAWEVLLITEESAEYAPVAGAWRVGLEEVRPEHRRPLPADPATRLAGTRGATAAGDVAGRLDELADLLARVAPTERDGVCAVLARRLGEEFVPAWDASRRTSRDAAYHFAGERLEQLDLLREAYEGAATLAEACAVEIDATPWRDDYLRGVVALVELLDPPLAATLAGFVGIRFDVDMGR